MATDRVSTKRRRCALRSMKRKDTIGIILLGDVKVGKTALVDRWLKDKFDDKYVPTVEDYRNEDVMVSTRCVNVGVVDIAGSGQFPAMDELYIKKSDSVIFVYEIGDAKSAKSVERYYNNVKRLIGDRRVVMTVAGTKLDKYDNTGYYDDDEIGQSYFSNLSEPPKQFLTSSKNNALVKDLFEHAVNSVANQFFPNEARLRALQASKSEDQDEKAKTCCAVS
ncbi:ras-related protein Rap-2b-like [Hydractinia symbiolongicarpus]|uniref:ras-related protein Rap-2b-like n=1 Tax=Hydractinia symbiolongicarpus TaxID=13093 RepID=UPI00254DEE23|nr:ras-related protein Rap-2b-like [Hydractinia symbiolongicarpus]